jgi:hypothetical protein
VEKAAGKRKEVERGRKMTEERGDTLNWKEK